MLVLIFVRNVKIGHKILFLKFSTKKAAELSTAFYSSCPLWIAPRLHWVFGQIYLYFIMSVFKI